MSSSTPASPAARPAKRRAAKPKLLGAQVRLKSGRYKGATGVVIPGGNGYLRVMLDGTHPDLEEGWVHSRSSLVEVLSYGEAGPPTRKRGRPPSNAASPAAPPARAPPAASAFSLGPSSANSTPALRGAPHPDDAASACSDDASSHASGLAERRLSAAEVHYLLRVGAIAQLPDAVRGGTMDGARVLCIRGQPRGAVGVIESTVGDGHFTVFFGGSRAAPKRRDELALYDETVEENADEALARRAKRLKVDLDDERAAMLLFSMATTPPLDGGAGAGAPRVPVFAPLPAPSPTSSSAASSSPFGGSSLLLGPAKAPVEGAAAPRGIFSSAALDAAALHTARDVVAQARAAAARASAAAGQQE